MVDDNEGDSADATLAARLKLAFVVFDSSDKCVCARLVL